jgi:hypothetical protein
MTPRRGQLPADDELWSLVDAVVAGTATPGERDRLEARLLTEQPARLFYVAYLDLHAQLQWRMRGQSAAGLSRARPLVCRLFRPAYVAACAACLALAVGLTVAALLPRRAAEDGEPPDLPEAPPGTVAVLIENGHTVWEKNTAPPAGAGSALPPGRLRLKAGTVEVAFHGGGEVVLEGPADFDVNAADRAFLRRGKLVAQLPEGAPAFRISAPGVVVTDCGGEYGLLSDESGRTEVHVFGGQVGASPTDGHGAPLAAARLAEKAGARVDAERRELTPVPLDERAFAGLRPEVRVTDATVRAGQFAGRNFGTASRLVVKNSIADYTWDTYLRFDLSGIKGEVRQAVVRLVPVRVGHPLENAAALVPDNRWGETTLTWDNKPPSGPAFARWTVAEGEPVEFDVTRFARAALAGDRKLSLRIFAPAYKRGSSFVEYGSRRGEAEARPQLLLTLAP